MTDITTAPSSAADGVTEYVNGDLLAELLTFMHNIGERYSICPEATVATALYAAGVAVGRGSAPDTQVGRQGWTRNFDQGFCDARAGATPDASPGSEPAQAAAPPVDANGLTRKIVSMDPGELTGHVTRLADVLRGCIGALPYGEQLLVVGYVLGLMYGAGGAIVDTRVPVHAALPNFAAGYSSSRQRATN